MDSLFLKNSMLLSSDGTLHRLLYLKLANPQHDTSETAYEMAWLISVGQELALPYAVPFDKLQREYRVLEPEKLPPTRESSDLFQPTIKALQCKASDASQSLSKLAYKRIELLVNNPDIFNPSTRHALLIKQSKVPGGGTPKTLLKDLRNWWQGGQTEDALLGKYVKCGRAGVIGTGQRGRKRSLKFKEPGDSANAHLYPYQLTQQDLDYMREVIENYFFDIKHRRTLTDTLLHLHRTHYLDIDGNGEKFLRLNRECPSYRQLEYFLKKNYPLDVRQLKRKGDKRFAQEDRSTQGSIQIECHGAGHIYEFDATIVDVLLVSSADRTDIVGKPTLYLIIDRHSRLIVGFYLGFENANFSAAMEAILSIGENKEELCRRIGLNYDPADWPAHCVLPEMFLADQGELMHKQARRIGRSLRTTLSNVPGLRPDWKPLVECGFRMIHQIIAQDTPAYSPDAEAKKRRGVNVDSETALNIHEFTCHIVAAIIAHNKTMQTGYPLTVAQVADNLRPIPRELFAHSVLRRMGTLDRMNFDKVREELLPRGSGVVTGDGILFERLHFSCPEAEHLGWLVQGRRQRMPIDIAFDYRLVDEIIVYSPKGSGESFVAKLTKDSVRFAGMSYKEVHRHFSSVAALIADADEVKRQARFEFHQTTKSVIAAAVAETKAATKGVSRSGRRKDVAPARAAELQRERTATAGLPKHHTPAIPNEPEVGVPVAPAPVTAKVIPINLAPLESSVDNSTFTSAPAVNTVHAPRAITLKERMAQARHRM
jgi:putative transposase